MDKAKLFDSLNGLFAYDTGCTDSGVKDEKLREEVKNIIQSGDGMKLLIEFVKLRYVNEPYTLEDVKVFIEWLENKMDYVI